MKLIRFTYALILRPSRVVAYFGAPFFIEPFVRKMPFCFDFVSNKTSESVSESDNVLLLATICEIKVKSK